MSERIREIYRKAGMKPPDGKGIHTAAFHRCVVNVSKRGGVKNPHAVCMASIGKEGAVKTEHRRGPGGHNPDATGPHGRGMGPGKGRADGSGLKRGLAEAARRRLKRG